MLLEYLIVSKYLPFWTPFLNKWPYVWHDIPWRSLHLSDCVLLCIASFWIIWNSISRNYLPHCFNNLINDDLWTKEFITGECIKIIKRDLSVTLWVDNNDNNNKQLVGVAKPSNLSNWSSRNVGFLWYLINLKSFVKSRITKTQMNVGHRSWKSISIATVIRSRSNLRSNLKES